MIDQSYPLFFSPNMMRGGGVCDHTANVHAIALLHSPHRVFMHMQRALLELSDDIGEGAIWEESLTTLKLLCSPT